MKIWNKIEMDNFFVEISIPEEKVFAGAVLPKTLISIDTSRSSVEDLVVGITQNKDWLCATLAQHGAVLFRGFNVGSGGDFRRVVEAFGWDEMDYVGVAPRVKVDHRVYTANEAPLHLFIDFHHEMSLMKNQPSKIFFCCTIPSSEGGETSIARSWVLLREMEKRLPEFMEKLEGVGFVAELVFPKEDTDQLVVGNTLASVLGTNDLAEAEERAKEKMACSSIELMENGSTKVTFGPLEPIRTLQGKRLWTYNIRGYGQKPQLGDGSPIPPQVSETYMKILNEIGVDIRWHKGDVLLVDNLSTMHARRPGKPPRQILVSICK